MHFLTLEGGRYQVYIRIAVCIYIYIIWHRITSQITFRILIIIYYCLWILIKFANEPSAGFIMRSMIY